MSWHDLIYISTLLIGGGAIWGRLESGFKNMQKALADHKAEDDKNFEHLSIEIANRVERRDIDAKHVENLARFAKLEALLESSGKDLGDIKVDVGVLKARVGGKRPR